MSGCRAACSPPTYVCTLSGLPRVARRVPGLVVGSLAYAAGNWASQGEHCSLLNLRWVRFASEETIQRCAVQRPQCGDEIECGAKKKGTTCTMLGYLEVKCPVLGSNIRPPPTSRLPLLSLARAAALVHWLPRSDQAFPETLVKATAGPSRRYLHIPLKEGEAAR